MNFYATFSIPFIVGVVTMFVVLIVKYGSWIFGLSAADRMRIVKGIPSRQTPLAVWEVVRESLLHRRIFKVNPLLGYMHMSLAFGWFLLIVVGWIETVAYLGFRYVPLHGHVFFKYFATELPHKPVFDFLMDLLLLFVLSGVTLAFGKRIYSQAMGMHRTTRHVLGDRIALSVLWLIFPARLLAESITCALHGGGGFEMSILTVQHLEKHFENTKVLNDISFSLEQGQALSIIGSSGSGKTTLLRCLNFLETPDAGTITVQDKVLFDADHHANCSEKEIRKNRLHFGMVFQSFNLFNNMTVLENCMAGQVKVLRRGREEAHAAAMTYLEKVGMAAYINAKPRQLSGLFDDTQSIDVIAYSVIEIDKSLHILIRDF